MARVLLVEDDPASRRLLRLLLEREAHAVWEAASPDEAWRMLGESITPELMIVDLRLGEESGIDLVRRVRADTVWAALPVVLCSAVPDRDSVLSSVHLGVAGFLTKPYDGVRIKAAISKVLSPPWVRTHFEDPVSVSRRLGTDRDRVAQRIKGLFAELHLAVKVVVETDEERRMASTHLAAMRRTAAELGLRTIELALAEWDHSGAAGTTLPELLQRLPVLERLYLASI